MLGLADMAKRTVHVRESGAAWRAGGRADGHMLRIADTAKRTVQVRMASTAWRRRGGRMLSRNRACGLATTARDGRHGRRCAAGRMT